MPQYIMKSYNSIFLIFELLLFANEKVFSMAQQPPINLNYQPNWPSFYPNSRDYIGQIVPRGQSWPSFPQEYDNFGQARRKLTLAARRLNKAENKADAIVFPGQGWSASDEEYAIFSQTRKPFIPIAASTVEKRFGETTTHTVLNYKPSRPSFHPNPGNVIAQIVPPGSLWPANEEGYANFSQTKPPFVPVTRSTVPIEDRFAETTTPRPQSNHTALNYKPSRPSFHPNPGNVIAQIVPPGSLWPANKEGYANFSQTKPPFAPVTRSTVPIEDRFAETTTSTPQTTHTVLDYKPSRPSFHPNPGNVIAQIVPPGSLWPANEEGYANFSQTKPPFAPVTRSTVPIEDRFAETTTSTPQTTHTVLDYKPSRPSFHPNPGNVIAQIVPPGKPWPASGEGYANFSQTNPPFVPVTLNTIEDRFAETTPRPNNPSRPHFLPNSDLIAQIVPPGKPWSASEEEYANFSQSSGKDQKVIATRNSKTTEKSQTELPIPFTSGTQRTTLPDIVDIIRHNGNLTSGQKAPVASHLLPFDIDNDKDSPRPFYDAAVLNPITKLPQKAPRDEQNAPNEKKNISKN